MEISKGGMNMKVQRREAIVQLVQEKGSVSLDELCNLFQVSKNTIRRDIHYLSEKQLLEKVYGGVIAAEDELVPFPNRSVKATSEKEKIGQLAAQYIQDGDLIFIDSGTTTKMIVPYLSRDINITILTNNLDVINSVVDLKNVQLILVGNRLKRATRSFVGTNGYDLLKGYNINKAFMAATGVSITNGLTNADFLEYEIKHQICSKAKQIFLLADHSKFDHVALMTYNKLENIDYLITDQSLSKEYETFCEENQITVVDPKPIDA